MALTTFTFCVIDLPTRIKGGDLVTRIIAQIVNDDFVDIIYQRLRRGLESGDITEANLQKEALRIAKYMEYPPKADDVNEIIQAEALVLAKDLIRAALLKQGIKDHPHLDKNSHELVKANPNLLIKAQLRIKARLQAALEVRKSLKQ